MMQMVKPKVTTANWTEIFPGEIKTQEQSNLFVKRLVVAAISNITYVRRLFPEAAYGNRYLGGLKLKILTQSSEFPDVLELMSLMRGTFDALDKKYLQLLKIGIMTDPSHADEVIEAYTFRFSYTENGTAVMCNTVSANEIKLEETQAQTVDFMKRLYIFNQRMERLDHKLFLTLKLLYYDNVTPSDYEPAGFKPAFKEKFTFKDECVNVKVGESTTAHHSVRLVLKAKRIYFAPDSEDPLPNIGLPEEVFRMTNAETTLNDEVLMEVDDSNLPYATGQSCEGEMTATEVKMESHEVRCPCSFDTIDDLMLTCAECNCQQHATCFGIILAKDVPSYHVCEICYNAESGNPPTDPKLSCVPQNQMQCLCLLRRVIVLVSNMKNFTQKVLEEKMNITPHSARLFIKRLEKDQLIKQGYPRGKKVLNKDRMAELGNKMYFPRYASQESSAESKMDETVKPKTRMSKRNQKANEVLLRTEQSNDFPACSDDSDFMRARGRKRPIRSDNDVACEFVDLSQDTYDSSPIKVEQEPKRRKKASNSTGKRRK